MKNYFIYCIPLLLLCSCTFDQDARTPNIQSSDTNKIIPQTTGTGRGVSSEISASYSGLILIGAHPSVGLTGELVNTGVTASGDLVVSGAIFMSPIRSNSGTTFSGLVMMNTGELTIQSINNISTLEDLFTLNPSTRTSSKSNEPNFLEIEKNKLILGYYISHISDPEYNKLQGEKAKILEGQEIWPGELKDIDFAFQGKIKENSLSGGLFSLGVELMNKRSVALKKFTESEEYRQYLASKKSQLDQLDLAIDKFLDPEALAAKENIDKLSTSMTQ